MMMYLEKIKEVFNAAKGYSSARKVVISKKTTDNGSDYVERLYIESLYHEEKDIFSSQDETFFTLLNELPECLKAVLKSSLTASTPRFQEPSTVNVKRSISATVGLCLDCIKDNVSIRRPFSRVKLPKAYYYLDSIAVGKNDLLDEAIIRLYVYYEQNKDKENIKQQLLACVTAIQNRFNTGV